MTHTFLDQTLGDIACTYPGATRVFHSFGVDFCCDGGKTLAETAHDQVLDVTAIVSRLESLTPATPDQPDWRAVPAADLIRHIVERFHERHRDQLPELIRLSRRVEMVHADRTGCPKGLADILENLCQELESHMLKEEHVLFPILSRGSVEHAQTPISVLRLEHDHHRESLHDIDAVTGHLSLPDGACNTWRALYAGLQEFRVDLMEHIHLENNVLFLNASKAAQGALNG